MTKLAEAAQLMRESGWYFDYRTLFLLFGALFEITYIYLSQVLRVLSYQWSDIRSGVC